MPINHALVSVVVDDGVAGEVGPSEWNAAHSVPAHDELSGLTDDDHTQYLKEKASGGTAAETPTHSHSGAAEAGTVSHGDLTSVSANQHHNQAHAINGADHTGTLDDSQIPASIARDSEVTTAVSDHAAAADPHTGYRLESADHNHQSTGAQAGTLDHGAALTGLSDDDHPQYVLWAAIQASQLVNEIMNFPSQEQADDTQPEWWEETDANATLTEVDVAGEAITETFKRAIKIVVASANSSGYQRYTYADQPRIKSGRALSAIFAVWSVSSVNARIRLTTSAATTSVSSTTTAAGWTILTVENITLDGTYVDILLEVDVGTAYFVPLGLNIGARAVPLKPRGIVYRRLTTNVTLEDFSGSTGKAIADVDCTANTSALAVRAELTAQLAEGTAGEAYAVYTRPNGSSVAVTGDVATTRGRCQGDDAEHTCNSFTEILDDQQIFESAMVRTLGTGSLLFGAIYLTGFWEWE